jgi:hypothetical protein
VALVGAKQWEVNVFGVVVIKTNEPNINFGKTNWGRSRTRIAVKITIFLASAQFLKLNLVHICTAVTVHVQL